MQSLKIYGANSLVAHDELGSMLFAHKTPGDAPVQVSREAAQELCATTTHRGGNVFAEVTDAEVTQMLALLTQHRRAYDEQEEELDVVRAEVQAERAKFVRDATLRLFPTAIGQRGGGNGEAVKLAMEWARALDKALHDEEG